MHDDPAVREIREARHRISEEFGHDMDKLVRHLMERQERHHDRLVDTTIDMTKAKPTSSR